MPDEQIIEQLKRDIANCIDEVDSTDPNFLDPVLLLRFNVVFYSRLISLASPGSPFDKDTLTNLCATHNWSQLRPSVLFWASRKLYKSDDKVNPKNEIFQLTQEAEIAIDQVFEQTGYKLNAANKDKLPGSQITRQQFIQYINEYQVKSIPDISQEVGLAFKSCYPQMGFTDVKQQYQQPSNMTIKEFDDADGKFWVVCVHSQGTLSQEQLNHILLPLNFALSKNLNPNFNILLFYPSVDDTKDATDAFNDQPRIFGMMDASALRFLNLLKSRSENQQLTRPLSHIFDQSLPSSFDYPPLYAISRLID